jgi:hypothetical protein
LIAALVAQAADLLSFLAMVDLHGMASEANPVLQVVGPTGAIVLKAALMVGLAAVTPFLGRYRALVLGVACAAGILGAHTNLDHIGDMIPPR